MTPIWHNLRLTFPIIVIAASHLWGCGGQSNEANHGAGGSAAGGAGGAAAGGVAKGGDAGQGAGGAVSCASFEAPYVAAEQEAKRCDPALNVEQCTQQISLGLTCQCGAFVNPVNASAIAQVKEIQAEYSQAACAAGVFCGPCLAPAAAYCSAQGTCEPAAPCPDGTAYGAQCARCGPTDACEQLEHGCFPTCTNGACPQPAQVCISGLCLTGVCG